jgi:hypothetical protein
VDALYLHCLKREADPAGRAHFEHLLTHEGWTFEQVASAFMQSEEYRLVNALSSPLRTPVESRPRVCFVHIEKTAGTSLHDYLMEIYPESELFPERLHRLADYPEEQFERYRLYSGHYGYCYCNRMPSDTHFLTFLRNPRERVLSLYYFWRSVREHDGSEQVEVARQSGLAEFLRHPAPRSAIDNMQLWRVLPADADTTDLDRAGCRALEAFDFVGVKELYALSVLVLARRFGWPLPSQLHRRLGPDELRHHPNHRPVTREPMTAEIESLLWAVNRHEAPVYDRAVHRLAAEFRSSFDVDIPATQLPQAHKM